MLIGQLSSILRDVKWRRDIILVLCISLDRSFWALIFRPHESLNWPLACFCSSSCVACLGSRSHGHKLRKLDSIYMYIPLILLNTLFNDLQMFTICTFSNRKGKNRSYNRKFPKTYSTNMYTVTRDHIVTMNLYDIPHNATNITNGSITFVII